MKKKILITFGIFLLIALAILFFNGLGEDDTPIEPPAQPVKVISVYVSGQVKNISVVEFEDTGNLKLVDAINAAGGLTDFADADSVNLAAPLSDGQHIHIPTKEIFQAQKNIYADSNDLVNINTANLDELTTLKGIGSSFAQRIIDYREQNGAFKSIDEIKNVRGIGEKKFAAIKDRITI